MDWFRKGSSKMNFVWFIRGMPPALMRALHGALKKKMTWSGEFKMKGLPFVSLITTAVFEQIWYSKGVVCGNLRRDLPQLLWLSKDLEAMSPHTVQDGKEDQHGPSKDDHSVKETFTTSECIGFKHEDRDINYINMTKNTHTHFNQTLIFLISEVSAKTSRSFLPH